MSERLFSVCPDCGNQFPLPTNHRCDRQALREFVAQIEVWVHDADNSHDLLWLYRVLYRLRSKLNGLGVYKDRAELARKICRMLEWERQGVLTNPFKFDADGVTGGISC